MFSKEEIIKILSSDDDSILKTADEIRKQYVGDSIHLRGLIEFSNYCNRTCYYCGLRYENKNNQRYRLSSDEIIESAKLGKKLGLKTIVLQSGEDHYYSTDILCKIIEEIKKLDVAITLSIGEKTYNEYKAYKDAGADRYLLRIETTDKKLYKKLHPNMSIDNRLECLHNLKSLGYETGSGCLVGLPEQTIASLADDILFFKELDADMIGIGPFIPHPNTPLGNANVNLNKNFELSIKVMALTRILLKDINIPATTAMETLNPNGQIIALQSGANVIMPNITNDECKNKYNIYPHKKNQIISDTIKKIHSINRTVSNEKGFRNKTS